MRIFSTFLAVILCASSTGFVAAAEWGNLKMQFVLDGKAPKSKTVEATRIKLSVVNTVSLTSHSS